MTPWAPSRWLSWLVKDSAVYGGAAALNKALALITFPILTRAFSVAEYGAMDLINVLANVLALAIVWGQDSAVVRLLADEKDPARQRPIVTTSLLLMAGLAVPVTVALFWTAGTLGPRLNSHADTGLLLMLVALQLPLLVASNFCQSLLRWTFRRRAFLLLTLLPTVVTALGVWLLARSGVLSLVGLFVFVLAVRAVAAAAALWACRGWIGGPLRRELLRPLMALAAPIGLVCVLGALVPLAERMAVTQWVGEERLGLYSVGATFAGLMALPIQAFHSAWGPFSLAVHRQADADAIYGTVARLLAIALCALVLLLSALAAPAIGWLATPDYVAAAPLVFPLALALAVQAMGWVMEVGVFFAKRNELGLVAYGVYLTATFAGIAWLGPRHGIQGIAWAVAVGQLLRTAAAWWLGNRVHPIGWPVLRIGALGLATIVLHGTIEVTASRMGPALGAAAGAFVTLTFVALSWRMIFNARERSEVLGMLGGHRFRASAP